MTAADPAFGRVAVVGIGRWGKKLVEAFSGAGIVVRCCNRSNTVDQEWVRLHHPSVEITADVQDALDDPRVGSIVIATPTWTHGSLIARALDAGKHVFVEKPLATSPAEARALIQYARNRGLRLFVDHTYLFDPALEALVGLMRADPPEYATLRWHKLGTFGEDLHWNLLSHDAAIALAIFGEVPTSAVVLERRGFVTDVDLLSARLMFGSGTCVVEIDRCMAGRSKTVRVRTRSGRVLLWQEGGLWELRRDRTFSQVFTTTLRPLTHAVACFLDGSSIGDELLPAHAVDLVYNLATGTVAG